tara:strand:- start:381 stop:623 length:243 start_codon:yes stop_codon:yes gene_type:complete
MAEEVKNIEFHKNNPDMMLYFEKPDREEIDEMNYCKPITSYKETDPKPFEYMDGSDEVASPNLDYTKEKNDPPGSFKNTQ